MKRAALVFLLLWAACSQGPQVAGGGGSSETTNSLVAYVRNADGSAAIGALVRLRRAEYVSPLPKLSKSSAIIGADALTDSNGRFEISGIKPGSYRVEFNNGHAALLSNCVLGANDTVNLGTDTLSPYATIAGTIDTTSRAGHQLYVQVAGLERLAAVNASGQFMISDLPAGSFTIRAVTTIDTAVATASGIIVGPGGRTDVIIKSGWRFSKRLYLNTTASGAGVSGNVVNFPVLVRLSSGNFDFSQAKRDGSDLRFTKTDSTPLSYEIERWDSANAQAEIWVRTDTVYGNNNTQCVQMYWGNPNAMSLSNGAAVFDTANGFTGVWHLNEAGSDTAKDASYNHYNGIPSGMSAASAVAGDIGKGRQFSGQTTCITIPNTAQSALNFPQWGYYTLSAWVYMDTLYPLYDVEKTTQTIISKGNLQYNLDIDANNRWHMSEYIDKTGHERIEASTPETKTWKYFVGVVEGKNMYLYLDGTRTKDTLFSTPAINDRYTGNDVYIGKMSDSTSQRYFTGIIDEVRMSNVSCSADWIKLCYMNQKQKDDLVVFK